MIPPKPDAEFVAHMETVMETCQRSYDAERPVVCMDEQPVQLAQETRPPLPATPGQAQWVDCEYKRAGKGAACSFSVSGWRQTTAREHRTKTDWAQAMAGLLEGRYADCEKVT